MIYAAQWAHSIVSIGIVGFRKSVSFCANLCLLFFSKNSRIQKYIYLLSARCSWWCVRVSNQILLFEQPTGKLRTHLYWWAVNELTFNTYTEKHYIMSVYILTEDGEFNLRTFDRIALKCFRNRGPCSKTLTIAMTRTTRPKFFLLSHNYYVFVIHTNYMLVQLNACTHVHIHS